MTGASALIADYYTGAKRDKALVAKSFGYAFVSTIFVTVSGFLANISWRFPFLIYGIVFVIFIFAIFLLYEPNRQEIAQNASDKGFRIWIFLPIYMLNFLVIVLFYIAPTQVPFVIINTLQESPDRVGNALALMFACYALVSIFYAKIRQNLSLQATYSLCFGAIGIGLCGIGIFHNYFVILIALALIGFGLGGVLITNSIWLFSLTHQNNRAKAYGFLVSSVFIGQFSSPLFTQPIVNALGLLDMFLVFGVVSLGVAGVLFFIKLFIKNKRQTL